MAGDQYWNNLVLHCPFDSTDDFIDDNTVLLLHMEGANAGTEFLDHSYDQRAISVAGNAVTSTTQKKFGSTSAYFDGTGDYLSVASSEDFGFGTGDFTIEGFINPSNVTGLKMIYDGRPGADGAYVLIYLTGASLVFHQNGTARITGGTVSANVFTHFAACRVGTTTTLYVGGVSVGTWVDTTNYATTPVRIGADAFTAANGFLGYIDELRVIKGYAKYTANFTPPDAPFANPTRALDHSPSKKRVQAYGNAAISSAQSKFGGYSAAFGGTGDYFLADGSNDFAFGTGDFTIECFVRPTAVNADYTLYDGRPTSTQGAYPVLYLSASGTVEYYVSSAVRISAAHGLSAGAWAHVALCRSAGTTRVFIDGVQKGSSYSDATSYLNGASRPGIATSGYTLGAATLNGYIDDFRITKGVARYTENFTPPTAAFPDRLPLVSGVVSDASNNFAQRLVRVHDRMNGTLLGQAESNGTTGEYSVSVASDKEVYVIAHDATVYDPYWDKVVLAMHMNDVTLSDVKGKAVVRYGSAARSATQSKFGGYSAYFGGSGNYLTVTHATDFNFGADDFTIEFFYCPQAVTAYSSILGLDEPDYPFQVHHGSSINSGNPFVAIGPSSSAWFTNAALLTLGAVTNGTWYHIAVTRAGDTFRVFKDGTQTASGTPDSARQAVGSATTLTLAKNSSFYNTCYIDDLRITKGVARYTANFTAPTAAFIEGVVSGAENAVILDRVVPG